MWREVGRRRQSGSRRCVGGRRPVLSRVHAGRAQFYSSHAIHQRQLQAESERAARGLASAARERASGVCLKDGSNGRTAVPSLFSLWVPFSAAL